MNEVSELTKDDFIKALLAIRDKGLLRSTKYLEMMRVHHSYDAHTITAGRLAQEVGYPKFNSANLQYGKLGHLIADELSYVPPKRQSGKKDPIWVLAFCSFNQPSEATIDENWEFVLKPEFVAALEKMNWVRS